MAFRYSVEVRNAGLDARIVAIGPSPVLKIFSGGLQSATELVSIQLEKEWMSKADDGVVSSLSEWHGKGTGDGKAKIFRFFDRAGKICHIEGSIPDDMRLDNPNIAIGQTVVVESFTIKSANS